MSTSDTTTPTPVITLTDAALKEVKRLINVQGIEEGGLRLGVKGGGCSGETALLLISPRSRSQNRFTLASQSLRFS